MQTPEETIPVELAQDKGQVSNSLLSWIKKHRTIILRVLSLLVVVAISVWIFSIRDKVKELEAFGYPGIFVICLLANATVLIPAPGLAIVFAMGGIFNPLFVGLVAGLGGGIGELTGYLAGFSGQGVTENAHIYERIHPYVEKYGLLTIFVMSCIPNPLFDLAGLAAGALKMPVRNFLIACILGKTVSCLIFAFAGAYSINWIFRLMH